MRKAILCIMCLALLLMLFAPAQAAAEAADGESAEAFEDESEIYTVNDASGVTVFMRAGRIYVDDEYISGDNKLYRVVEMDDATRTGVAALVGDEPMPQLAEGEDEELLEALSQGSDDKLIALYCTHSDESYEPSDGTSSKLNDAGIYDVGEALKENLEERGATVILDKTKHHPHDAGAYRRSRKTAVDLLKKRPEALIDVHRDGGVPPKQYETKIDGDKMTKVRLFVGRSNPNSAANREFAKKLKAVGDKEYPGFIKDIYIGKGNYNQELYPRAILLEFGTNGTSKEDAIASTKTMSDVLMRTLFGSSTAAAESSKGGTTGGTAAEPPAKSSKGAPTGILWLIGLALLAAVVYALMSTGTLSGLKDKLGRMSNEVTGGVVGKKPEEDPNKHGDDH